MKSCYESNKIQDVLQDYYAQSESDHSLNLEEETNIPQLPEGPELFNLNSELVYVNSIINLFVIS